MKCGHLKSIIQRISLRILAISVNRPLQVVNLWMKSKGTFEGRKSPWHCITWSCCSFISLTVLSTLTRSISFTADTLQNCTDIQRPYNLPLHGHLPYAPKAYMAVLRGFMLIGFHQGLHRCLAIATVSATLTSLHTKELYRNCPGSLSADRLPGQSAYCSRELCSGQRTGLLDLSPLYLSLIHCIHRTCIQAEGQKKVVPKVVKT